MSPVTQAPMLAYASPARCASICAVLELLAGPARADVYLEVDAVSRGGYGREHYQLPVAPRGEFVDPVILKLLEEGEDWAAYVHLAARERNATGRPVRLNALMVSETLPLSEGDEHRQSLPADAIARTVERFCAFMVPPSAIIVGGARIQGAGIVVAALYALTHPIDVGADVDASATMALLRRLAFGLAADGLEPDVTLADLHLPLPGTAVRELPAYHQLDVTLLLSDRRYAVEDLRAILQES